MEIRPCSSFFGWLSWPLQQFLQFLLQNLVGPLLGIYIILVGLLVNFLLLLVGHLHLADLGLQLVDLAFEFPGGGFKGAYFVFHVLTFLLGLERAPHAECDGGLVEGLI